MVSSEIVYPELFTTQRLGFPGKDYSIWKLKIHFILANKGIDYVLHQPQPPDEPSTHDLHHKWLRDDATCRLLIDQCVEEAAFFCYRDEPTAKSVLDSLEASFNSTLIQRRVNLFRSYVRRRMSDGASISNHVLEMRAAAYELELAGVKVPDEMQAALLMNSLPESWNDVAWLLNLQLGTGGGKESELGFYNVSERLRAVGEMKLRRSRGGNGGGSNNARFEGYCYLCRQMGHNKSNCPEDFDRQKDNSLDSDKDFDFSEELTIFEMEYYCKIKTMNRLKYTGTNFTLWKWRLSSILCGLQLGYVLTQPKPTEPNDSTPEQDVNIYKKWLADDFTSRHLILGGMEDNLLLNFHNQPTAKALMDAIDAWFNFPSLGRRMALCKQYVECIMSEDTKIRNHTINMISMVHELNRGGIEVPDEIQAVVLMNSLPRSWADMNITMTMRIDKNIKDGMKLLDSVTRCVTNAGDIHDMNEEYSSNNHRGKTKKGYTGRY